MLPAPWSTLTQPSQHIQHTQGHTRSMWLLLTRQGRQDPCWQHHGSCHHHTQQCTPQQLSLSHPVAWFPAHTPTSSVQPSALGFHKDTSQLPCISARSAWVPSGDTTKTVYTPTRASVLASIVCMYTHVLPPPPCTMHDHRSSLKHTQAQPRTTRQERSSRTSPTPEITLALCRQQRCVVAVHTCSYAGKACNACLSSSSTACCLWHPRNQCRQGVATCPPLLQHQPASPSAIRSRSCTFEPNVWRKAHSVTRHRDTAPADMHDATVCLEQTHILCQVPITTAATTACWQQVMPPALSQHHPPSLTACTCRSKSTERI